MWGVYYILKTILKSLNVTVVWKGFKYMHYLNVFYGGYKKVIKSLMYFSPPTKCFYGDVLSNILHTILSKSLQQGF